MRAKAIVDSVAVINDHAERVAALIQEYSGRRTKCEEHFQYILKLVADNRKKYPKTSKQTLLGNNE